MANIKLIKGRIKSAKNIAQITKAMELVAASKMKKAQSVALAGKLYANKIYQMVMELASRVDISSHPLLIRPKVLTGKHITIFVTANKGLSGALNTNSFRFLLSQYPQVKSQTFVTLGTKGAHFVSQTGATVEADFSGTLPWVSTVPAVIELVTKQFLAGAIDGVDIVFNEFISAIKQQPVRKTLLPLSIEKTEEVEDSREFLIEPNAKEVFDSLLPHYLENQLRDAILQSEASEHSARMMAMRNATDNAMSLMEELTLQFNKARQEKITYEIGDMVTARLALE